MITIAQAEQIILNAVKKFSIKTVKLNDAYGAVLREDITADRDLPAFDKSVVDGIAIAASAYAKGQRIFVIGGLQRAGQPPLRLRNPNHCIEIMTGAVIPKDCDCVIPVEQTQKEEKKIIVNEVSVKPGQLIRRRGADHKKNDRLLNQGILLQTPQIAIAASVGKHLIKVSAPPQIAIISTGDELVDINRKAQTYQIRTSNSYAVQAALYQNGFPKSQIFHLPDSEKLLFKKIGAILKEFGVVILSGGVSMGQFDFVPRVLKALDVEMLFHKVRQRPGKPFWFGKNKKDKLVFALPGNPVSTIVCTYRYVLPALRKGMGLRDYQIQNISKQRAVLDENIPGHLELALFLPVKSEMDQAGQLKVQPVHSGGSGDFGALGTSDGFVELKEKLGDHPKGEVVPFYPW